ncbi:hypothetical protein XSR1_260002 [Xenorhabdus szentirmaii DSM 16338]|uniref:Uncharacterized protein n=1 Tax=Xenorhabdus szentirmaii DSM 16338 TaxID=1427518 RepID=W1IZ50_9GAMM|nr:hypothetical protein XSR1_260002 [Xenorhabdus szentirmaii DSM 16338]
MLSRSNNVSILQLVYKVWFTKGIRDLHSPLAYFIEITQKQSIDPQKRRAQRSS